MASSPRGNRSEGERKQVTVLFADIAGFTSLSEDLDPEEVRDLISPCLDFMAREIRRHGGVVAQFLGDGLMALFGAPVALEDAPQRAVHAALSIQGGLQTGMGRSDPPGLGLEVRLGVNTGLAVVGSVGEDESLEFSAIGDTVNVASRMEEAAEPGTVLVAEDTYRLVDGFFDFEPLGEIQVKGKRTPVRAYRVLSTGDAKTRMEAMLPRGLSTFVGRNLELEQVDLCLARAREGRGQVVGITGEPGVGKSRLMVEFKGSLQPGSCRYIEGGCLHYGDSIAYLPVIEILRSFFEIRETDDEAVVHDKMHSGLLGLDEQLPAALNPLRELLSLKIEDAGYLALEPVVRRQMVFESVRNLLVSLARDKPLVLVIEDLHWIDRTSEEFLGFLVDSLAGASIMLVLLYRPEYAPAWTARSYWTQVSLPQLSLEASAELISSVLPGTPVSRDVVDLVLSRTSGNPLFMEEMTRSLLETGAIRRDTEAYVLTADASTLRIPDTVQGIIASRLDRLEPGSKTALQTASVIGREFTYRLLEVLTGTDERLKEQLAGLQSLEFVYEKSLFPELEYIFKHALVQEVTYESLLKKRRREIHASIGHAIENLYPDRLEEFYEILAYHYSRSNETDKAIVHLKLAGQKATDRYSCKDAIGFFDGARRILDERPGSANRTRDKFDICYLTLGALMMLSYPDGSLEVFDEAERLARELGDPTSLSRFYGTVAIYHSWRGNTTLSAEYSEKCFEQAEKAGDFRLMAVSTAFIANACYFRDGPAKLVETGAKTIEVLEDNDSVGLRWGGFNVYFSVAAWLGTGLGAMGRFEESDEVLERSLEFARHEKDPWGIGWIELHMANVAYFRGHGREAISRARSSIEHLEESGIRAFVSYPMGQVGLGYYMLGDYEQAEQSCTEGLRLNSEMGFPHNAPLFYIGLALTDLARGDTESAMQNAKEGVQASRECGAPSWEGIALETLGRMLVEQNPAAADAAFETIRAGIALNEEIRFEAFAAVGLLYLGEGYSLAGKHEDAVKNLREAETRWIEMGCDPESYWLVRAREGLAALDAT